MTRALARCLALALSLATGPAWAEEPPPLLKGPEVLTFVPADYPLEAEAQGLEGTVRLQLTIDASGAVTATSLIAGVHPLLDRAALQAATELVFSPAEDAGGPVPIIIEFAYGFELTIDPAQAAAALPPVNLDGLLRRMGDRQRMGGVTITATDATGTEHISVTDEDGHFAFRALPVGTTTLTVDEAGHAPTRRTVDIGEAEVTTANLWLKSVLAPGSTHGQEIVITEAREADEITRRTISIEEVRRVPGTFGDPLRVIQSLPGAARAPLGSGMLVIRGANPEDTGVYIDGIRIPLIYHLGGFVSVINADLIAEVDYLPGGYGVAYGRSLGGVIAVTTSKTYPERARATWNTDLLDSGGLFMGRAGKDGQWGVAAAARRSYIDVFIPLFTKDSGFTVKPRWFDYQAKLDRLDLDNGELSLFIFGFEDLLTAQTPDDFAQGTDSDTQGDLGSVYGTHRATLRYARRLSDKLKLSISPSFGIDTSSFSLGDDFRVDIRQANVELRQSLAWEASEALTLTQGIDFIGGPWAFELHLPFTPDLAESYDPIGEREDYSTRAEGSGWAPDVHIDAAIRPLKGARSRLLIKPGLRVSSYLVWDKTQGEVKAKGSHTDPRLAFRWLPREGSTLKGGTGIYSQPPQPFELWNDEAQVRLNFEEALSTEIGFEQDIGPAISFDATAFHKDLRNLVVANAHEDEATEGEAEDHQYYSNAGIGRVYGAEFILRHPRHHRFFGWLSYTLSKSERNNSPEDEGDSGDAVIHSRNTGADTWYPHEFDQTHILVAVASQQLGRDWEISGRFQWVTGNPFTAYEGGIYDMDLDGYIPFATGQYNAERMPAFVALDLRVDKRITFQQWQLDLYVDLLNLVRGENPEYVIYSYDYTDWRYMRGLPFIPSPGFEARFDF